MKKRTKKEITMASIIMSIIYVSTLVLYTINSMVRDAHTYVGILVILTIIQSVVYEQKTIITVLAATIKYFAISITAFRDSIFVILSWIGIPSVFFGYYTIMVKLLNDADK